MNSFIKGLELDYEAVINSMKYSESNSLTEASVHKVKKVKRIMHGRSSFALLNAKVIMCEN